MSRQRALETLGSTGGEAQEALRRAVLDARRNGQQIPCHGPQAALWLSEDRSERKQASTGCHGCPVMDQCRKLADTTRATWGVWAGQDRDRMVKERTQQRRYRQDARRREAIQARSRAWYQNLTEEQRATYRERHARWTQEKRARLRQERAA
jgi:hypothetical protein